MFVKYCLLSTFVFGCFGQSWVNDYDGYLYYECPEGQGVNHIVSIHDNRHEDRMWAYECAPLDNGYDSCAWSGYVNNFDEVRTKNSEFHKTVNYL